MRKHVTRMQGDWRIYDETAAEIEMQLLLHALVRMLKPMLVVETGAYLGHSTRALGQACLENKKGRVVSCEPNGGYREQAIAHCKNLPVEIRDARSDDVPELEEADFVFSDSDYKYRMGEIDRCKPGALIVVHDTRMSYDPGVAPLDTYVKERGGIVFNTYRGFGFLMK